MSTENTLIPTNTAVSSSPNERTGLMASAVQVEGGGATGTRNEGGDFSGRSRRYSEEVPVISH